MVSFILSVGWGGGENVREGPLIESMFSHESNLDLTMTSPLLFCAHEVDESDSLEGIDNAQRYTTNSDLTVSVTEEGREKSFNGIGILKKRYAKRLSKQTFIRQLEIFGYKCSPLEVSADDTVGLEHVAAFAYLFKDHPLDNEAAIKKFLDYFSMEDIYQYNEQWDSFTNLEMFSYLCCSLNKYRHGTPDGQHRGRLVKLTEFGYFLPMTIVPITKTTTLRDLMEAARVDTVGKDDDQLLDIYEKSQMFTHQQISIGVIMDAPSFADELKIMKKFGEDLAEAQQLSKPIDFCDVILAIIDRMMEPHWEPKNPVLHKNALGFKES